MTRPERLALVDHDDPVLPVVVQCRLLRVARSTLYYRPVPVSVDDLAVMRRMDELHLERPFYGSRRMAAVLRREGWEVNRKRAKRLMTVMAIEAIYQKPNTSKGHPDHKVYPYLLRGLIIERPNQVWCADITYIPMAKGFVYLVAVMDWFSRRVLSWRLSITMETDFCVDALTEAMERYGRPEIFNTDQGVQFTSAAFVDELADRGVRISMDGKGRYLDNIFIERLWRSLKYEEVYIRAYDTVAEARRSLGMWLAFYNNERPHQSLEYRTPREMFEGVACEYVNGGGKTSQMAAQKSASFGGVSLFGWRPFPRPGLTFLGRRAQPRSRVAAGHRGAARSVLDGGEHGGNLARGGLIFPCRRRVSLGAAGSGTSVRAGFLLCRCRGCRSLLWPVCLCLDLGLARAALAEAVAVGVHLEDADVMCQAIEQRAG